jgi:cell division protein FtsN
LLEFFAGILVVLGAIGFYQLGKNFIGPYFYSKVHTASGVATTEVGEMGSQTATPSFVRSDIALIPDETTVTIEPLQTQSEVREEEPSSQPTPTTGTQQPQETPPPQESLPQETPPPQPSQPKQPSASVTPAPTTPESEAQPERSKRTSRQAPKPEVEKETIKEPSVGVGKRYQVQAGFFKLKENASKLVQELIEKGYQPSIEVVKGQFGESYRVVVGAFDERSDAEKLKQELEEQFGISAVVREVERR